EVSGVTITAGQTTDPIPIHSFPFAPTGVKATAASSSQIDLSWNATDDVGVIGYKIYRNGSFLKEVLSTSASDTKLNPSTEYCYTVSAFDEAGNESEQSSPSACATTPEEGTCIYTISPMSRTVPSGGGNNYDIVVTSSVDDCSWTAIPSEEWIKIEFPSSGSGSGDETVIYSVLPNNDLSQRSAWITVAGIRHYVTQEGLSCTYSIIPERRTVPSSGGDNYSISVTSPSGCDWTATESASWIDITSGSSGSGSDEVTYKVDANPSSNSRTATITVAGKSHTVTQEGLSCTYSIIPERRRVPSSGGDNYSIAVTTSIDDCAWTAAEDVNWITITSGSSGTGNRTVYYSVSKNPHSY
ncbi:MAG: BACON domain-containing protein, partial [bacterium]